MALTARQRQFVIEYLIDFNGTQAAIRAGYSPDTAQQIAYQLLQLPSVMEAINEKIEERATLADLNATWVLKQWKKIAEADPNELIYTRLECCRFCYGVNHDYHWTEPEFREALHAASLHVCGKKCQAPCKIATLPNPRGGFGFDPRKPPLEECPQCHGEGVERIKIHATNRAVGAARRLYAGVKQTKDGIEIKMRDQDGALNNIAKYLGMLVDKRELAGPGGGPIPVANFTAKDLTDDQLAQFIANESNVDQGDKDK